MTPDALAAIHAVCFSDTPRPWTATEFETMLAPKHAFLVADPNGFAVGRVIAGEAELLTLAVRPDARRRGLATRLLVAFETEAAASGALAAMLEVAENNAAARALYRSLGYGQAGQRPGYYRSNGARPVSALILRKRLPTMADVASAKTN